MKVYVALALSMASMEVRVVDGSPPSTAFNKCDETIPLNTEEIPYEAGGALSRLI